MVNGMADQKVYANALSLLFINSTESLGLLKEMYGKVTITPEVEWRLETPPLKRLSPIDLKKHPWIKVAKPEHLHPVVGDAVVGDDGVELFSAAREAKNPLLILDGRIVRQIANSLHFRTTGTLGILLGGQARGEDPQRAGPASAAPGIGFPHERPHRAGGLAARRGSGPGAKPHLNGVTNRHFVLNSFEARGLPG